MQPVCSACGSFCRIVHQLSVSERETTPPFAEESPTHIRNNFLVKASLWQAEEVSSDLPESRGTEEFKLKGRGLYQGQNTKWIVELFARYIFVQNYALIFQAFGSYLKLAKQMKFYEDTKFSQWQNKSVVTITSSLKKNVLKVVERKTVTGRYQSSGIRTFISIYKLN
jgi:hypothetical protein